ncbi:MAG: hypothetical protein Q3M24_12470 [Candidatus Electrothrix aestuarii]|nr:hypothetical protein [Candidatus Electrothrix aestuarii]
MPENEEPRKENKTRICHAISVVIIGIGIGWLMGLSISPVVANILSGILGAVLVLAAILSGFSSGDNVSLIKNISDISPVPFAWLMFGIILGTSSGIWVRTNNVLGIVSVEKQYNSFTKLQEELTQLKDQEGKWKGLGLPSSDIAQRILDKYYPKNNKENTTVTNNNTGSANDSSQPVLFSVQGDSIAPCKILPARFKAFPKQNFRNLIKDSSAFFEKISEQIDDDDELKEVIKVICEQANGDNKNQPNNAH